MPPPDTRPANENGDIDLIFHVKEKRTGNVNFGASVGQGTGVGGFLGFDQRICLASASADRCSGSLASTSATSASATPILGSVNRTSPGRSPLYNQRSRFIIRDIGQSNTSGGQLQLGFPAAEFALDAPVPGYGGERVSYGGDGLVGTINCNGCFRSTLA